MIGIGTDILEIERLEQALQRTGGKILEHILTPEERKIAETKGKAAIGFYAGRWTAKEAVVKLYGTGISQGDIKNCIGNECIQSFRMGDYWLSVASVN